MSFTQSPYGQISNEEFFQNPRLAMLRALQNQGINTDYNYLARRQLDRSNELVPLAYAYGADQGNFPNFAEQYANAQFRGGGQGQFSNQDIRSRINQLIQGGGGAPGSDAYEWLRQGDPQEQQQRFATLQALGRRGELPGFAQARAAVENRSFEDWWRRMAEDPTGGQAGATTWIDAFLGRQTPRPSASGAYAAPSSAAPGAVAPSPANAPGSTPAGSAPPSSAQMQAQTAAAPQFGDWQQLFNYLLEGHDPRNLMTSGFTAPGRAFTFGNVSFNPAVANSFGRTDRDASSRFGGGAAWTGFAYRLRQLIDQRNRERAGGVDFPAVSGDMTDQDIARLAAQWVNQRWSGNTGLTVA